IDVIKVAQEAMEAFGDREIPLQVAVMGCVVNGPGEARDADLGIAAGRQKGHLFIKGRNVAVVPEDEMVSALVEWAELIMADGVRADGAAFGYIPTSDRIERMRGTVELGRTLAAFDGDRIVGTAAAFTFELTLPGLASAPAAGVTWVAVLPSHRRRGVLRSMM